MSGTLVFQETGDERADMDRMSNLFRLVSAFPGDEPLWLEINTLDGERIHLKLPSVSSEVKVMAHLRNQWREPA